jgi:hypothetical protein
MGRAVVSKKSIQSGDKVIVQFKDGKVPLIGE